MEEIRRMLMFPKITDIKRQLTMCPECGAETRLKQIVDWGVCEECRKKAERENDTE